MEPMFSRDKKAPRAMKAKDPSSETREQSRSHLVMNLETRSRQQALTCSHHTPSSAQATKEAIQGKMRCAPGRGPHRICNLTREPRL